MSCASQYTQYVRYKAQSAACPVSNTSKRNFSTFVSPLPGLAYCGIRLNFLPNLNAKPPVDSGGGGCPPITDNLILDGGMDLSYASLCILSGGAPSDSIGQLLDGGAP